MLAKEISRHLYFVVHCITIKFSNLPPKSVKIKHAPFQSSVISLQFFHDQIGQQTSTEIINRYENNLAKYMKIKNQNTTLLERFQNLFEKSLNQRQHRYLSNIYT